MPNDHLHAMLDVKLKIWRSDPSTKDIRPFVVIKIVPFNEEWKMKEPLKPIKVKVKKEHTCKIRRVKKVEGRPDVFLKNKYEVLVDVTTDIIWPEKDEAYDIEIDAKAKPETYTVVTKKYSQLRKSDYMIYGKPLQEGTTFISRDNPNFDNDFPVITKTIDNIMKSKPVVIMNLEPKMNTIELKTEKGTVSLNCTTSDNMYSFKEISQLSEKDHPMLITEFECIKGTLALLSEGPNTVQMNLLIANLSSFIDALKLKYVPDWMNKRKLEPPEGKPKKMFVRGGKMSGSGIYSAVHYGYSG